MNMKKQTKAKKLRKPMDEASKFFLQLGLSTFADRSRFLPTLGNSQKEDTTVYIPRLSGNSQPFCINEY
jgi:hypothetical protein